MSKSIISNERKCLICGTTKNLHKHHVIGGSFRNKSEKWGCWVYLCAYHHDFGGKQSVHGNAKLSNRLKQQTQNTFECLYGRNVGMEVFKKNYLEV